MSTVELKEFSWERMIRAVEQVRERLGRATAALEQAGIPYAVTGGNAVAAWVSRVDVAAVRNTQDVDLLMRRSDVAAAESALKSAGFVHRHAGGIDMFVDGPGGKARDAVHILFACEKVLPEYLHPAADVTESEPAENYRIVSLNALVRMKLTSFRDKDRTHLRDLLGVGLIDQGWLNQVPADLAPRLQQLLDTPQG